MLTASNTLARLAARRGKHALDRDLCCDQGICRCDLEKTYDRDGQFAVPASELAPSGPGSTISPASSRRSTCRSIRRSRRAATCSGPAPLRPAPPLPLSRPITVKAQSSSQGTRGLLEHLKPGVKIRAIGPSGIFSFHRHHQESFQAPVATEAGAKPLDDVTPDAGARSGIRFALSKVSVRCAEADTVRAMEPRRVHRRVKSLLAVACRLHPELAGDHPDPVVAKVDQGSRRPPGGAGEMAGDGAERDDLR